MFTDGNKSQNESKMKNRIRKVMEYAGLTQQEFSARISIPPSSLSSIFTGRTNPTQKHVQAIHQAFPEINISWLMFGEGEMLIKKNDGEEKSNASPSNVEQNENLGLFAAQNVASTTPSEELHADAVLPNQDLFSSSRSAQLSRSASPARRDSQNSNKFGQSNISNAINIDIKPRKIKEIRVFYDDGTYEVFGPTTK